MRTHIIQPLDAAHREIKIQQQRTALRAAKGAWKQEDHPELTQGAAAWVREIRPADADRVAALEQRMNRSK
jgi:hypothetical protein